MAVAVTGIAAVMVMRHWRAGRLDRAEEAVQDRPERLSDMLVTLNHHLLLFKVNLDDVSILQALLTVCKRIL